MDQPQPMSQVLLVPVHAVKTRILSTCQCRALSFPHDLESGVLSDPSMDRPCGEGGPMLQSQRTGLVLAPRRGPCPPGLTCLQETEDHTAQEAGAHGGGGAGGGPSGLSVDERGEGRSREALGDFTVPARPHSQPVTQGPRLFPQRLKSEMNLSEQFKTETAHPDQWT